MADKDVTQVDAQMACEIEIDPTFGLGTVLWSFGPMPLEVAEALADHLRTVGPEFVRQRVMDLRITKQRGLMQ